MTTGEIIDEHASRAGTSAPHVWARATARPSPTRADVSGWEIRPQTPIDQARRLGLAENIMGAEKREYGRKPWFCSPTQYDVKKLQIAGLETWAMTAVIHPAAPDARIRWALLGNNIAKEGTNLLAVDAL